MWFLILCDQPRPVAKQAVAGSSVVARPSSATQPSKEKPKAYQLCRNAICYTFSHEPQCRMSKSGKMQGVSMDDLRKVFRLFTCILLCAVAVGYKSEPENNEHITMEPHHREAATEEAGAASTTAEAGAL